MIERLIDGLIGCAFLCFWLAAEMGSAWEPEPTKFENVRFFELSEIEINDFRTMKAELVEQNWESALLRMRKFLLLRPDFCFPGNGGNFLSEGKNVAEECANLLAALPPEGIGAWRARVDETVRVTLSASASLNSVDLIRLKRQNPHSSYEQEILELLARRAWEAGMRSRALEFWERELAEVRWSGKAYAPQKALLSDRLFSAEELEVRIREVRKTLEEFRSETSGKVNALPLSAPAWQVTMTQVLNPEGEIVFEDFLPEEQRGTLFADRKRKEELERQKIPQFLAFSSDRNFLVARLGTHVTFWPDAEREVRPQAYLVLLDASRGGSLIWLAAPESPQRVLIGNPLADARCVYVPSLLLGSPDAVSLDVYALADGVLIRRVPLFETALPERFLMEAGSVFLPIQWGEDGRILVGGKNSGVQATVESDF